MTPQHNSDSAPSQPVTNGAAKAGVHEWLGLALLSLPSIMLGVDLTLLHLMLPALAADLQPTSTQALWIMDAYGFMIAGFLVTMGTLGDRIGRRKLLLIGAAAFAVTSVFAAASPNAGMLIVARAALAVAAATLMPSTLSIISNLFHDPRQRALGFGICVTSWGVGYALGPAVGGLVVDAYSWRAAFLLAVPVVALLLVLAPYLLPEYRAPNRERLDLLSVMLSLAAILPVVYGIKQIAKYGFPLEAFIAIALGSIFAVVFVRRQCRLADPLLDMTLFRGRAFSIALIVLLVGLVAIGGAMLLVAQYLQLVAGYPPWQAGLWMGLAALVMIASGVTAPLIARYIRPGYVVAASLILSVVGYLLFAMIGDNASTGVVLAIAGLALAYLGNGTISALGTDLVVGSAPPDKAGSASAMNEAVQDLGISIGIAVLGSISTAVYRYLIVARTPDNLSEEVRVAVDDSLWAALAVSSKLPAGVIGDAQMAFTTGFKTAAVVSAVSVTVLAVLAAVTLRHVGRPRAG